MSEMLGAGSNVLHRFPYLVNKIKFPLSGISTLFSLSTLVVHLGLIAIVFAVYFACGMPWDIYLLQIPVIILVMFLFFTMFSILTSQLSAISRDFSNMLKAIVTPLFWLSGIIFDIDRVDIDWIQGILLFNPITFFARSFRDAFYAKTWIWEQPLVLGAFVLVFVVTFITMLLVYKRFHREVSDAL